MFTPPQLLSVQHNAPVTERARDTEVKKKRGQGKAESHRDLSIK